MAIFSIVFFLYLTLIAFPFIMGKLITTEVRFLCHCLEITKEANVVFHLQINRTKRRFENIAFHWSTNRTVRQKIESISNLSEKAGFTCFDWFLLDPYTGLKVEEVIQINF